MTLIRNNMFVYEVYVRTRLAADMHRPHVPGQSTVSSLTTSTFFILLHNIPNYIMTNDQLFDIIMPSLLMTHHVKFILFRV